MLDPGVVDRVWGHVESGRIEIVEPQRESGRFAAAQSDTGTSLERLLRYSGRQP